MCTWVVQRVAAQPVEPPMYTSINLLLFSQQFVNLCLDCFSSWKESCFFYSIVGSSRSRNSRDKSRSTVKIIEAMLNNPGMNMASKSCKVSFFSHDDYPV